MDKPNKVTFVDYKFVFHKETHDIEFDKELNPEHMKLYDGKTYKVKIIDGHVWLKFYEDWDMMPDLELSEHFNESKKSNTNKSSS